jgi:hypothetical protein
MSAFVGLACDASPHGKDASTMSSQRMAQVSVRVDLPAGTAPAVSVLAFRAEATEVPSADVLGTVDPLVTPAPESSCELREVGGPARALRAQGGGVSLQELDGVAVQVTTEKVLRAKPRVYPPLADVVSGVIAEAGPYDLEQLPESFMLSLPVKGDEPASLRLTLPAHPQVADSNEVPLDSRSTMSMKGDLVLHVAGPPHTFLEIRPFGAPSAIACAVPSSGWVVVPHDLLAKLIDRAGRAPVSFEAVWRENRQVSAGSEPTRVSFEARSSAVLELKP